jgi:hypothetical protein
MSIIIKDNAAKYISINQTTPIIQTLITLVIQTYNLLFFDNYEEVKVLLIMLLLV